MNIGIFSPYGSALSYTTFANVFAKYLSSYSISVNRFSCNGFVSVCGRDAKISWKRNLGTCLYCIAEQKYYNDWADTRAINLSSELSPELVSNTQEWVEELDTSNLFTAEYQGHNIYPLVKEDFSKRFLGLNPDLNNGSHVLFLKRLLISAVRGYVAAEKTFTKTSFVYLLLNPKDILSKALALAARTGGISVVQFETIAEAKQFEIVKDGSQEKLAIEAELENIFSLSKQISEWPAQLQESLSRVTSYLDINISQMSLPLS